jgi:succinyl-diaminopimelate desuccinylase
VRFNDNYTQESLRALIEIRAQNTARGYIRWHIEWEPSNADVFLAPPGPFIDLVVSAIEKVTGRTPALSTSGGTSDARFIKDYCPVLEFGLVGRTMHQVDERTPVDDLVQLTAVYRKILEWYFGYSDAVLGKASE